MVMPTRRRMLAGLATVPFLPAGIALAASEDSPRIFVAMAIVREEERETFERFVEAVTPLWHRHAMAPRGRLSIMGGSEGLPLTDATVIEVASDEGFSAYLADPDYAPADALRKRAAAWFAVADGPATKVDLPLEEGLWRLVIDGPRPRGVKRRTALVMGGDAPFRIGAAIGPLGPLQDASRLRIERLTPDEDPHVDLPPESFAWVGQQR